MSRIIYVFYLFTKALRDQIEKHPGQRFVQVKLTKTYLHLPLRVKKVVGVFIALNFLSHSELFEERHCVGVLRNRFPELSLIQGSFFSRNSKEELVQLLYFEVEKEDGSGFSLSEVKNLKERLPDEVRNGIEKLTRPVFMPRNEEEVMRNIITLSNQLKFFRDLPQVIITFDEQAETQLSFTVVLVRALKPADLPVQQLFESAHSFAKFSLDRVKKVGMLRNKYPKEATVCRLRFDAHPFLRPDHSVDLFKARQSLVQELVRVLGDFRDYNGGMIAKQHEQYIALKKLLQGIDSKEELLLENFFHSIFPVEMRSLFNPIPLRNLFSFVREKIQENKEAERKTEFSYQADEHHLYFVLSYEQTEIKDAAVEAIQAMQIPSSQLLTVSMRAFETGYFAFIYKDDQPDNREKFLKQICPCLESLTFEPQTSYH